uniref:Uncharacterized protein n=1 Tax=Timema bartmani TaxID=61472 RepID=A0A7R9EY80_9NEOP|nr:unnamed protein product [Timema bartmani]
MLNRIHDKALSAHIMPKPSDERLKPYTGPNKSCVFCFKAQGTDHLSEDVDELLHGKFYKLEKIITHYFCLLLSSGIAQNGDDNEGILGFLPKDITKELTRSRCLRCTYCKQTGATIECCARRCKKIFHLPCGTKRGSIHHYFNNFQSFCPDHRPPPVLKPKGIHRKEKGGRNTTKCVMCLEEVVMIRNKDVIQAPCCGHCSWFHRLCVQKLANNAGYFFKCPCCNNKNIFQKAMLHEGIFIPDQDASWELAPNAFSELLERPNECEAEACLCPKGKKHVAADLTKWSLLLCNLCGSMAVHRGCANLCEADAFFECESCSITSYEDAAVGDQAGTSKNKIHGSAKRGKKKRGVSWKNGISTKVKKKEYQQGNNRKEEPAALMVQEESSRSHSDDDDDEDVIVVVDDDDDDDDDVVLVNYIPSQPSVRIAAQQEDNLILTMDGSSISVLKLEQRPDAPDALRDVRVVGDVNVRAISPPRTARTKHFVEVAGIPQEPQAIVLNGSHSLLRSSDRIKPRSGDWVVTIDFLQEAANTSLSSGSNACEIMPVIQNVHSLASVESPWNTQPTPPAPQQQLWNSDFSEARPWVGPSAYKQPPVETTKLQQNIDSSASLKTSLDLLFHMGDTSSPLQRISLKPGTNMVDIMRGLRCCVVDSNGVIVQSDALLTPQEIMPSDSTNTTAFSQLSSGFNNDESSSVVIKQPNETTTTQDINQQWVNSSLVTLAPSHPGLPNYSDQSLHFHSNAKKGGAWSNKAVSHDVEGLASYRRGRRDD